MNFGRHIQTIACAKAILWGKEQAYKRSWENWMVIHKRMKLNPYLTPYAQINSKWIKDISIKTETMKLLAERRKFHDIGLGNDFLVMTRKSQETTKKQTNLTSSKLFKNLCIETPTAVKWQPTENI